MDLESAFGFSVLGRRCWPAGLGEARRMGRCMEGCMEGCIEGYMEGCMEI